MQYEKMYKKVYTLNVKMLQKTLSYTQKSSWHNGCITISAKTYIGDIISYFISNLVQPL